MIAAIDLDPSVAEQVGEIRKQIAKEGGATVGCEELRILCPDYLNVSEQFMRIAYIAEHEGWSFAFLPDGSVRFGAYEKSKVNLEPVKPV